MITKERLTEAQNNVNKYLSEGLLRKTTEKIALPIFIKNSKESLSFDYERKKRSEIQYETTLQDIKTKAETSLKRAKEFLFEMESLL